MPSIKGELRESGTFRQLLVQRFEIRDDLF